MSIALPDLFSMKFKNYVQISKFKRPSSPEVFNGSLIPGEFKKGIRSSIEDALVLGFPNERARASEMSLPAL